MFRKCRFGRSPTSGEQNTSNTLVSGFEISTGRHGCGCACNCNTFRLNGTEVRTPDRKIGPDAKLHHLPNLKVYDLVHILLSIWPDVEFCSWVQSPAIEVGQILKYDMWPDVKLYYVAHH